MRNLRRVVSSEEAVRLIAVGAADVHGEVQPADRDAVIGVYNTAITNVFVGLKRARLCPHLADQNSTSLLGVPLWRLS